MAISRGGRRRRQSAAARNVPPQNLKPHDATYGRGSSGTASHKHVRVRARACVLPVIYSVFTSAVRACARCENNNVARAPVAGMVPTVATHCRTDADAQADMRPGRHDVMCVCAHANATTARA